MGTILKWGDIDKCRGGGAILTGRFAVGRFDQVPFEDVSDEDIVLLLEKRDSHSTNNVIKGAVRILQTYCLEKNFESPPTFINIAPFQNRSHTKSPQHLKINK
jgi:hypothetical protein